MKNFINKISFIFILSALCVALSSCYSVPTSIPKEAYNTPEPDKNTIDPDKVINIVVVSENLVWESWPLMNELYALSGMKANYKTIRPTDWQDAMSKILASDEQYDMMELDEYNATLYKTKLLDITPYLAEYAPNYAAWANKNASFASAYNYGQPIAYFPFREDTNTFAGSAFVASSAMGADSMTLEAFYEYVRDKQVVCNGSTYELVDMFAPYFGTSTYWYTKDNVAVYGPTSEEFKQMLNELSNMYSLGIIPNDFEYAPPSYFTVAVQNNTAALALSTQETYEFLYSEGYTPIMLNFADDAYVPSTPLQPSKMGSILTGTGNEFNVLKFIDTCFSKEGRALLNYGVQGVHTLAHADGAIEYLEPYTLSGAYQWRQQGLTPEGLPGVYYNSWARYEEDLLSALIPLRQYLPQNNFHIPYADIPYTSMQARKITKTSVESLQYEWWNAFIRGEKTTDWDWGAYISELTNAGCYQGYLSYSTN